MIDEKRKKPNVTSAFWFTYIRPCDFRTIFV